MLTQGDIKQENEKRLKEIQSRLAVVRKLMEEACKQLQVKEKQNPFGIKMSRFFDPAECDIECNMVKPIEHNFKTLAETQYHERGYYMAMHEVISKLKTGGLTHEQALKHVDAQAVMEQYSVHLCGEGFEGFTIDRNGHVIRFVSHNVDPSIPSKQSIQLQWQKEAAQAAQKKQSLAPLLRHKGVPVHEKKSFAPRS